MNTMAKTSFGKPPCRSSSPMRPAPKPHMLTFAREKALRQPAQHKHWAMQTLVSAGRLHTLQQPFQRGALIPQCGNLRPVQALWQLDSCTTVSLTERSNQLQHALRRARD